MKANTRRFLAAICGGAAVALLPACVPAPRQDPAPAPTATPVPTPTPVAAPSENGAWRDQPATAGDWSWSRSGQGTLSQFAQVFAMRCNPLEGTITLSRARPQGDVVASNPTMTVRTQTTTRVLPARWTNGAYTAALPARDPLLDAMAFSRGRFAVETSGMAALYLPSWPEVGRVIEDCR